MEENSTNELTKEKEYKKFINFGKLSLLAPTFVTTPDNFTEKLKEELEKRFSSLDKFVIDEVYDPKQEKVVKRNEKLEFTKITSSNSHFFGTFSRVSNNKDVLTDIIDNESNKKIDPNTIYFEHNTLFYIDYSNSAISFIKTNHIKNVYPFLETFINHKNILNIQIVPLIKTNEEIEKLLITQVDLSFASTEVNPNDNFVELNKLEKMGCKVKDYKISVSLEKVNEGFSSKLLKFRSSNEKKLKKMSISTQSEDIDLLTSTFTRAVPIKLSNNYEEDYTTIEYTLKNELLKAIQ